MFQWYLQQSPDAQTLEPALAEAQRLNALNDSSPLGHLALGYVYLWQKQYEPARAEMERAITLDPNLTSGYVGLAYLLSCVGRSEEAVEMVEQSLRRKPWCLEDLDGVGAAYDQAGRPEEAIAPLKQYISHYPKVLDAHLVPGGSLQRVRPRRRIPSRGSRSAPAQSPVLARDSQAEGAHKRPSSLRAPSCCPTQGRVEVKRGTQHSAFSRQQKEGGEKEGTHDPQTRCSATTSQ